MKRYKGYGYGIGLAVCVLLLMAANLAFGSVDIPVRDVWSILRGEEAEKAGANDKAEEGRAYIHRITGGK